jgi:NADH-quinone oxidoreductase subunit H
MLETLKNIIDAQFLVSILVLVIGVHGVLVLVAYGVYLERKICSYIQDRIGPNRVGFDFGLPALSFLKGMLALGQPLADGLKFFLKEDFTPRNVDKVLFTLAPAMALIPALIGFVIMPWGGYWAVPEITLPILGTIGGESVAVSGANVHVGIIYLLAVGSIGVYGVTLGGWASNNKFSMLGGLRATAQMISYEIPLGLALLSGLLIVGSFMPNEIVGYQAKHGWLIFTQPLAALLFYICGLAEANRAPFDNAEAEQELVGGFHTEYSSMRFALFFMAEYAHLVTACAFFALMFLGGYHLPLVGLTSPEATGILAVLLKVAVFGSKVVLLVCLAIFVRWTIPRIRYDQVMMLGWQAMIPAGMLMIVVTSIMVYFGATGFVPMIFANLAMLIVILVARKVLVGGFGISTENHRIRLYGSRYSSVEGERVVAHPTHPMAIEDRPTQGTVPTA